MPVSPVEVVGSGCGVAVATGGVGAPAVGEDDDGESGGETAPRASLRRFSGPIRRTWKISSGIRKGRS